MNKNKGPLFLDENGVIEQPEKIKEAENKTQEKITIEHVNNEIITAIQKILEVENIGENIDVLISYLELFGFNINDHIILDDKVVNDAKITYKYKLSIEGEKSIIRLLTYQEAKKLISQKLESGINFTSLNKKLRYLNSNKGQNIKISDNYNEAELSEILKISKGLSTDSKLSNQISELIKKLKNQDEYKTRLEVINQAITSVNFHAITPNELSDLSSEGLQNPEDTFSLYRAIILEAEQLVKSNYTEISYSYSEENTEYIESKREEKNKKIAEQQEVEKNELKEKINLEKLKKRKRILKKSVIAGMFGVIIGGGIILDKKYGKEEIDDKQNRNLTSNIHKENLLIEEIRFKNYESEFDNFIKSFMNTVGSTETNIDVLKGLLANNIQLNGRDNHLRGKNIKMNISNSGIDTLLITIEIGNTVIINNKKYSRKPLHKIGSIEIDNQNKLKNKAESVVYKYMEESNNQAELIENISSNFGYIIREVFPDYTKYFTVSIEFFGDKVYIKSTNNHTNKEYNLSFVLDKHLQ